MKILYRQTKENGMAFERLGISQCYLKKLLVDLDFRKITNKAHHHNGFEIHIIENGYQKYQVGNKEYKVSEGEFLLIPCGITHRVTESASQTAKYSITFSVCPTSAASGIGKCVLGSVDEKMRNAIEIAAEENAGSGQCSEHLAAGAALDLVVRLLRASGMTEAAAEKSEENDPRVAIAKQYIIDNADQKLSVSEISDYCYLSEKQLTRLFAKEGTTPADYIRTQKIKLIERYLNEGELSLKEISERLNFANEYYFNTFFKKYSGMTPGEYRKMSTVR